MTYLPPFVQTESMLFFCLFSPQLISDRRWSNMYTGLLFDETGWIIIWIWMCTSQRSAIPGIGIEVLTEGYIGTFKSTLDQQDHYDSRRGSNVSITTAVLLLLPRGRHWRVSRWPICDEHKQKLTNTPALRTSRTVVPIYTYFTCSITGIDV